MSDDRRVDLYLLVARGDTDAVRACLEEDPGLVHRVRWSGVSPLHRAVERGDTVIMKLLIEHGADVNARAAWGWYTPLHLACKTGNEAVIWMLLDHGARWNLPDKAKKTPLQWAVRAGKASVAYRIDQQLHAHAKEQVAREIPDLRRQKQADNGDQDSRPNSAYSIGLLC